MNTQTTASFPKFEQNQILSSSHLNQLRQYLDEGNRLTRVRLSGVGIVCGLKLKYTSATKTIEISSGYGITTEGFLIELDETVFTHYKSYYDPSDPYYEFGHAITDDGLNETTGVEVKYPEPTGSETARAGSPVLYELLESTSTETKQPLTALAGISNMAVVLYLEFVDEALKKCTGTNCDNKGTNRVMTVRALLVDKSELFTYDRESLLETPDELNALNIPRLSNNDLKSVNSNTDLRNLYLNKVHPASFLSKLNTAIQNAYDVYKIRLGLSGKHLATAKTAITNISSGVTRYYQYVADCLKDIVVTYNEFAEMAYSFSDKCGATITTFPRHLTIGALVPDDAFPYDQYRTDFFDALPPDRNDKTLLKAQMLFQKMLQLPLCFKIPVSSKVDATPGKYVPLALSNWSVPFYYDPNLLVRTDVNGKGDLLKLWNPAQTLRNKERDRTAYYVDVFSTDQYFKKPYSYSVEELPFNRIEGIQGKDRDDAIKKLNDLKDEYNLGFDVVAVRVDAPGDVFEFQDCAYGDLQEEYFFHRKRLLDFIDIIYQYAKIAGSYVIIKEGDSNPLDKIFEFIDPRYEELKKVLPECLEDFNYTEFKSLYKNYLNKFIDLLLAAGALKAVAKVLPSKDPDNIKSIESLVSLLLSLGSRVIYKMIDSIFYNKLYRIYYRYTDRIYRHKLQTKFSKFAELHPGMEHLEGLRNHETLVLVYAPGSPTNFDPPFGGKGVSYMADLTEEEEAQIEAEEMEIRITEERKERKARKEKILEEFEKIDPEDKDSAAKMEELLRTFRTEK